MKQKSILMMNVPIAHYGSMDLDSLAKVNGMKKDNVVAITKDNVEEFVRTRDTDKDYSAQDRPARQQAYYEETVTKLYGFVSRIVTNVSYQDIVAFGNMMLEYKYSSDQNYVLAGKNGKDGDYDAYYLDQSSLKDMIVRK